jgi:hypothetical protein
MFDQPNIRRYFRNLEWHRAEKLLKASDLAIEDLVDAVLKEVIHSGCLILRYRKDSELQRRADFCRELEDWLHTRADQSQSDHFQKHKTYAAQIEEAFASVMSTMASSEVQKLSPEIQPWAVIDRAVEEYAELAKAEAHVSKRAKGILVIDAVAPKVSDSSGNEVSIDNVVEGIAQFLTGTLQMLAHFHGWFKGKNLVLPARIAVHPDDIYKAGTHSYLSSAWRALLHASEHSRFHDERVYDRIDDRDPAGERHWIVFDLKLGTDLLFRVARVRQHQIQLQIAVDSSIQIPENGFKNPRTASVSLPPNEYVSRDELISMSLLDGQYHLDTGSSEPIAGLTLKEWVRAYATLKWFVPEKAPFAVPTVPEISKGELKEALVRGGIRPQATGEFIKAITFSRDSRDIYDSPLLETTGGKTYFLAPFFHAANLLDVVISQLSTRRVKSPGKGEAFESAVLQTLNEANIKSKGFCFTLGNEDYQCDAAFVMDGHLFVLECKNYLLPPESPAEEAYFMEEIAAAAQQARRVASALERHPEIVAEHLGSDHIFTKVVPVVLNAMSFSIPKPISGVYFYDYSSLSRFFESPDLYFSQPFELAGEPRLIKYRVARLWMGDEPTASDLLKQLESPTALIFEKSLWSVESFALQLSENRAFLKPTLRRRSATLESFLKAHGWSDEQISSFEEMVRLLGDKLRD